MLPVLLRQAAATAKEPQLNPSTIVQRPFSREFVPSMGAGQGSLPTLPSYTWDQLFVMQEGPAAAKVGGSATI